MMAAEDLDAAPLLVTGSVMAGAADLKDKPSLSSMRFLARGTRPTCRQRTSKTQSNRRPGGNLFGGNDMTTHVHGPSSAQSAATQTIPCIALPSRICAGSDASGASSRGRWLARDRFHDYGELYTIPGLYSVVLRHSQVQFADHGPQFA
jgi:hypothetical protein